MSSDTLPSDFDADDGWDDDKGVEKCPRCQVLYTPNGGYTGPVFDSDGTEYEYHLDTDPADGPFFCADCWAALDANRKAANHKQLTDFDQ